MRDRDAVPVPNGGRDASDGELLERLASLLNRLDNPPEVRLVHPNSIQFLHDAGGSR